MQKDKIWELLAKKLAGEATLPELKELETLMKQESELHYPLQTVSDLWHHKPMEEADPYEGFQRHLARMKTMGVDFEENQPNYSEAIIDQEQRRPKGLKKFGIPAFVIVFLLASGLYYYNNTASGNTNTAKNTAVTTSEVSTKYGSKTKLVLPDGTQVWLNSGSRLTYDKNFGNNLREVVLSGEAFFDVVKNPQLPFVIHASAINIKVLGTAFNVKSYPGEKNIETSLVRGSIEVTFRDRPTEKIILKPNEKLVIANEEAFPSAKPAKNLPGIQQTSRPEPIVAVSHLTYQPIDSTVIETSWMEGKLIFRSETFEDLAVRMERWFGVSIRFANIELKEKKITGIFENETIEQALEALQLTVPFKYAINKKEIIISN
jgi:ferric-dicitrate binding protein FerR (iron transport regulator)